MKIELDKIYHTDCMEWMKNYHGGEFALTLTDIPYGGVNFSCNGLRKLDKGKANETTFDLLDFLKEVYRVTKGTIIIFLGLEQLTDTFNYFLDKQRAKEGTVRQLIYEKTNPSPMNGQHVYLSGIENAIWFRKRNATFNSRCKNTVFKYPSGRSKLHPTEKNHELIRELILDNSNVGDVVFDPCAGSGAHCLVAKEENRHFIGLEIDKGYFEIASQRTK